MSKGFKKPQLSERDRLRQHLIVQGLTPEQIEQRLDEIEGKE